MINYKYISLLSQIGGKPKKIKVPSKMPKSHSWLYCPLLLSPFHDVQFDLSPAMIAAINAHPAMAGTNVSTILSIIRDFYIANDIDLTNRSNLARFHRKITFDDEPPGPFWHLSAGSQERLATRIGIYAFVGIIANVLLEQFPGQPMGFANLPGEAFAEATTGHWPRMIEAPAGAAAADPIWRCNICKQNNSTALLQCSRCHNPRGAMGAADAGNPREASWACDTCTFTNGMDKMACSACTMPKNPRRGAADVEYSCTTCTSKIVCEFCGYHAMLSLVQDSRSRLWICPQCTHPNEKKCNVCNTPF